MTRVPWRHSLVTRLLATSVLIAIAAIGATAWLAVRTATRAISQEQGRSLTDDKGVYDMLIAYAAAHPDWSEAPDLIRERAAKLDRRITLMTEDRQVIIDSGPGPSLAAARPSAEIDPLDLDLGLTGGTDRIDSRAVGPYLLPAAERNELRASVVKAMDCLDNVGVSGRVVTTPSGRPLVETVAPDTTGALARCTADLTETPTRTEEKALRTLGKLTSACLGGVNGGTVLVSPQFSAFILSAEEAGRIVVPLLPSDHKGATEGRSARVQSCLEKSRRAQLQPYVAPPALLFVTDPDVGVDETRFTLSRENTVRIVTVTGSVLLATIVVTVLAGRRLVRPLRALTEAADRQAPVVISGRDEIAHLARALHASAEQRRAMVNDVAHELRTPLTNIRSWLEAAQDDLAPTDAQLVDLLHEESVLLQHLIDDLGDLAAVDAGTLRVHPEPIRVRDVVEQVADAHRGTGPVRLETLVDGDPVVRADPVRLRQVVGNLVSNAIRYTPEGGSVTVSASQSTITVRDTGIGISEDDLPRVFDRFWRADESRSRATGGSGLGLAITRKLVEAHGGTIEVASTRGVGTVFTVRLPS
ncbi:two-component sensor histidine kinase [Actinoplanes philippinensis]|uniref:histidine kinase n=1 Tax=Actinoplanes philippinensis TaxID=35752 RepID=A0A1I2KSX8_9ACTN|nr:HAMP domain-containing sensor histidine kinase [Actinoplanes philippinensis]GIE82119.1 two-component sensor histidine kinase [Actinoplanes philippinensis]SFF69653.1 two-component system, OmpR family, sensor histidine kinase BaeS [Actinoplanes philippinensis]